MIEAIGLSKFYRDFAAIRDVSFAIQKRTYSVKTEGEPSARFADWVNAGLLRMPTASIRKVSITSYMLDLFTGALAGREDVTLVRNNGEWKSENGQPIKQDVAKAMAATLDSLKIVDARPKPAALAKDLRAGQITLTGETAAALRQSGFFITQTGRILASDGEMVSRWPMASRIKFGSATSLPIRPTRASPATTATSRDHVLGCGARRQIQRHIWSRREVFAGSQRPFCELVLRLCRPGLQEAAPHAERHSSIVPFTFRLSLPDTDRNKFIGSRK